MFWIVWLLAVGSGGQIWVEAQTQRVAPGVPPQQYQQPQMHGGQQMHQQMPPQQMHNQQHQPPQQYQQPHAHNPQQPPMQQAQPHFQNQQPPMQQQQQQQQHHQQQQVPVQHHQQQGGHHHVHDQNPQQLLNPANMAHEKEHIAEHLDVPMDTNKMTDQELQFHYFKMHDADNNNKLDGCELIKSLIHWHDQGNQAPGAPNTGDKIFTDDELVALIDPILSMDDTSQDGYIDYPEFIRAQQKAAASGTQ